MMEFDHYDMTPEDQTRQILSVVARS